MPVVVPGEGRTPCDIMLVGERPGYEEARDGRPFVGASGKEMWLFLSIGGIHRAVVYVTNLVKDYHEDNADPTKADIDRWTPELIREIEEVRPRFILAVGRFATRWFLGDVDMDSVHGTPQRSDRVPGTVIIPCYHPAYGLHDPDAKGVVYYDFSSAAKIIKGQISAEPVVDAISHPAYWDVDDLRRFRVELRNAPRPVVALDTEGTPDAPWSFQISTNAGTGLVVRAAIPVFGAIRKELQAWIEEVNPLIIVHNAMYDLAMMRAMGLDIASYRLYDTMVAAYLLRLEPQSLKHLARRHCGMSMVTYREMIGYAADKKREDYLWSILEQDWPKPDPRLVVENDLTTRIYKPQPIERRIEAILLDWDTARENLVNLGRFVVKPDAKEDFDVSKRFHGIDDVLRCSIEEALGPFPDATLDDVPRERAIRYSGRDPDATLRVYDRIQPMVSAADLDERHGLIMSNIPSIEEMQATGMLADRLSFGALVERMDNEMEALCSQLSNRFNGGQPINPNSGDQVAALMRRRGLVGLKKSKKTRKMSTSKKSIEHLRHEDEAISLVEDWRERAKTRDSFGDPILSRIPADCNTYPIRCNIRVTRVSSSRLSATDPPLLAIPVRHDLGLMVRRGFVAPTAQDLITHYGVPESAAGDTYLGSWDLSQIEMRFMAHASSDRLLCQLFEEDRDIHAETAIKIFGLQDIREWDDIKHEFIYPSVQKMTHRNPTKRAGFGVITGIQGVGLLDQLRMMGCLGWDEEKCDDLIKEWFKVYPGVRRFLDYCKQECNKRGYIRDIGGMYRYLPGIWSRDERIAAEAGRQAHSHYIQGSAQYMIQRSMSWLKPHIKDLRESSNMWVRWLLLIHDETIFGFDQRLVSVMDSLVVEALTQHSLRLRVPVKASGAWGLTWAEVH